jgi:hypothetical protein
MSFILDALKKSETDRQRQSGPALYEMRVARPARMVLPPWAVAILALLGVNLAIIGWLLLHHSGATPQAPASSATAAPQAAALPAPGAAPAYYGQAMPGAAPPQPAPGAYPYPYPPQAGVPVQPQPGMPPQGMQGQPMPQPYYPPQGYPPQAAQMGTYPPAQPPVQFQGGAAPRNGTELNGLADTAQTGNPDDYAPAEAAATVPSGSRVRRGTESGLPLYPDPEAAVAAGLPKLHMDFHVYGATPQQRFVMINTKSLYEGQVSPDGVRVDEITPDGAAVSKGNARYFLPRP